MLNRAIPFMLAAAVMTFVACVDKDETTAPPVSKILNFKATLNGASEVPTNSSAGTGTFTATLDTSTNRFDYTLTYSGVGSNVTAGHIHGPASTTVSAGVILNFTALGGTFTTGATSGTGQGSVVLSSATTITPTVNGDSLRKLILAGLTYANIHTQLIGAGEIRGQITRVP